MGNMDMGRLHQQHGQISASSRTDFGELEKLVVQNGQQVRLIGDFDDNWEHFVKTANGSRPYYCGGPDSDCPLCQAVAKLAYSDDEEKQKLAKEIKARQRFYFNVIDRTPAGADWHSKNKKAKLLVQNQKANNIGSQLFQAIAAVCQTRRQLGQPDDPNTYDILLQKSGSGFNTTYGAQYTGNDDPLTDDEMAYELNALDQISKISTQSELQTVADYVLGLGGSPNQPDTSFDPSKYDAQPPQGVGMQQGAPPAVAPPPAMPPQQVAQQPAAQQPPVALTPQQQYQDTTPVDNYDQKRCVMVPCSNCQAQMMIDLEDVTSLKCHNCGTVYAHPKAS